MKKYLKLSYLIALLGVSLNSYAANNNEDIKISAETTSGCLIIATDINFGIWNTSYDWTDKVQYNPINVKCSKTSAYTISGSAPYLLPHGGIGRKLLDNSDISNSDYVIYNIYLGNLTKRTGIIGEYEGQTVAGLNDKGEQVNHKLQVIKAVGTGELVLHELVARVYGIAVSQRSVKPGIYTDTFTFTATF